MDLPGEKIEKIANEIEIAMFGQFFLILFIFFILFLVLLFILILILILPSGTFGDVGSKYMNKYRSLAYNIKVGSKIIFLNLIFKFKVNI